MRALTIMVGRMIAKIACHDIKDWIDVVIGCQEVVLWFIEARMMFVGGPRCDQ